ncbi:hypothetical protein D9758_015377 [Tetrapyrgos nigripes]|uniref:Integrase catalytic domain-containing protein n=1 Tax=Tetrapyrgos nigripes TaxID=182062 RepID=A0A8H5CBC5_9AGAR|nr:hypothetical protein D9758_015377 [Tetrapyrgos nigripes]
MAGLPPLPPFPSSSTFPEKAYSPSVYEAYHQLESLYSQAARVATMEADAARITIHAERIAGKGINILLTLEEFAQTEHISTNWIEDATVSLVALLNDLTQALGSVKHQDDPRVDFLQPVTTVSTGKPGRPRKEINVDLLLLVNSPKRQMRRKAFAQSIGVSPRTLRDRLKENNLNFKYSELTDDALDDLVKNYRNMHPGSGINYVISHLRNRNLRLQRSRVIDSIHRVDGLGRVYRTALREAIARRVYKVLRPHALWHLDGHHKLILWGIVIHGMVDGYSRTVTGIRASNNNRASTVLEVFVQAVEDYAVPSRIRGDRGKENKAVAVWITVQHGPNRGSFIWGSSTHNTRIERLWVEVGRQFVRRWRAFFFRLEDLHGLQRHNPYHLWIIQHLFLEQINADCKEFQREWNSKPLTGMGHLQSPDEMLLDGLLKHGVYLNANPPDECASLSEDEIMEGYGIEGHVQRLPGQTGAGHAPEDALDDTRLHQESDTEDDPEWEDISLPDEDKFSAPSVKVPRVMNPFAGNQVAENIFVQSLQQADEANIIPDGYNIRLEEWDNGEYPSFYHICSGKKRNRELLVQLPDLEWRPRSEHWVRALEIYNTIKAQLNLPD